MHHVLLVSEHHVLHGCPEYTPLAAMLALVVTSYPLRHANNARHARVSSMDNAYDAQCSSQWLADTLSNTSTVRDRVETGENVMRGDYF